MAENSKIEWTDHTFNPWRGCTKVSDGCKFCYAETLSNRFDGAHGVWGPKGTRVVASESMWRQPLKWDREAGERFDRIGDSMYATSDMLEEQARRPRVFCASLADVFEGPETMPESERIKVHLTRGRLLGLIRDTPNLDWLLLTKRPENVVQMIESASVKYSTIPDNVWIGTSVENQATADERIPHLLQIPAKVRFLSCEPLIGSVSAIPWLDGEHPLCPLCHEWFGTHPDGKVRNCPTCDIPLLRHTGIQWVICGGESGSCARPMQLGWAISLQEQCQSAGVPFFMKQLGRHPLGYDPDGLASWPITDAKGHNIEEFPVALRVRQFPEGRE